jgi:hypothetical protein
MSTRPITIAIDPGASGAMAVIDSNGNSALYPFREYAQALEDLQAVAGFAASEGRPVTVWLEEIPMFAGKNGASMIKLGINAGWWQGACQALRLPLRLVRPQVWQAGISGVGKAQGPARKRALKEEAARRFPAVKVTLANCDALLIADYGRAQEVGR